MLIHLSDVLSEDGKHLEYKIPLEEKSTLYHGQVCELGKTADIDLFLTNKGDHQVDLVLDGSVHVMIPCDRCLELTDTVVELHEDLTLDLKDRFSPDSAVEDEEDVPEEQAFLQDLNLDTQELVNEVLAFSMPEKVLCKEDCKGICSQCGQNLNLGSCDCEEQPKDPRMAAILDLFNAEFK